MSDALSALCPAGWHHRDQPAFACSGAARVTEYGAFLRIKLTEDRAEVWAISVEAPRVDKLPLHRRVLRRARFDFSKPPRARLIDHFELKPRSD